MMRGMYILIMHSLLLMDTAPLSLSLRLMVILVPMDPPIKKRCVIGALSLTECQQGGIARLLLSI